MIYLRAEFSPGTDLSEVADDAIAFASSLRCGIAFTFNGIELDVTATESVDGIVQEYDRLKREVKHKHDHSTDVTSDDRNVRLHAAVVERLKELDEMIATANVQPDRWIAKRDVLRRVLYEAGYDPDGITED